MLNVKELARRALLWLVGSPDAGERGPEADSSLIPHPSSLIPPSCPHCEGLGRVRYDFHCDEDPAQVFSERASCPLCGGVGVVPGTVRARYRSWPGPWVQALARCRVQAGRN